MCLRTDPCNSCAFTSDLVILYIPEPSEYHSVYSCTECKMDPNTDQTRTNSNLSVRIELYCAQKNGRKAFQSFVLLIPVIDMP